MGSVEGTRVRELFSAALELEDAERAAFLEAQCGDDTELREYVEALLAADRAPGTAPIEKELSAEAMRQQSPNAKAGQRIGNFEIVRVLGIGGMSTVFEARQEHPNRLVALKTMRIGLLSKAARRRFDYETEILGRLRHPGIAQVYEAGTWHEPLAGQEVPFFAMEYVEGARPLDRFVAEEMLDLHDALELFLEVCDAVHHGHQLGFIHRDLKPANVLVDAEGRPKVIDFGIARATDADVAELTLQTRTGDVLGTLRYMAPEQLDAVPDEIDTRIDVYALGVMLYELLAGAPPFDPGTQSLTGFAQRLRDVDPPLPSRSTEGFELTGLARDLDWITHKAMAAEKSERYRSVSELAADVRRFLDDEPISVGPPGTAYYLRKFVRRNKALVSGLCAVFVVLVMGIVATSWQMVEAQDARDDATAAAEDARRQQARAERVRDLLKEILKQGNPAEGRYRATVDTTVKEAIDMIAARLEDLEEDPEVEADVRIELSQAYRGYGDRDKALLHARRALELREKKHGQNHVDVVDALTVLGLATGQGEEKADQNAALDLHRRAGEIARRLHGDDHHLVALSHLNAAKVFDELKQHDEARSECETALGIWRRIPGDHVRFIAIALQELGDAYRAKRDAEHAVESYREALAKFDESDKGWHVYAAQTHSALADLLEAKNELKTALPHRRRANEIKLQSLGQKSKLAAKSSYELGTLLLRLGEFEEAASWIRAAEPIYAQNLEKSDRTLVELRRRLAMGLRACGSPGDGVPFAKLAYEGAVEGNGENNVAIWQVADEYGRSLRDADMLDEAEALFRKRLAIRQANTTVKDRDGMVMLAMSDLGVVLTRRNKTDAALELFEKAVTMNALPADSRWWGTVRRGYGECLRELGRFEQAETQLLEALRIYAKYLGDKGGSTQKTLRQIVLLYEDWKRPAEAEKYRRRLTGAK